MLSSVAKDVYLSSGSKTTHYAQNYLLNSYNLSIALFFRSFNKASGLLFIFVHVSTGSRPLSNDEIRVSWVPMRPSTVFF